jgi:hypothetical protein
VSVVGSLRICALFLGVALVAACGGGTAGTPQPAGYPLNACPVVGAGAITASSGYQLVTPGEIAFGWKEWHNETPAGSACGAQSVKGAELTIHRGAIVGNVEVNFVATLNRVAPLAAPDPVSPRLQLFRIDDAGPTLLETVPIQLDEQYKAMGAVLPGAPVGRYRVTILSQANEVLADGTFTIVE